MTQKLFFPTLFTLAAVLAAASLEAVAPGAGAAPLQPVVEIEEPVYEYAPADNGAGPLWCYGATCIVRHGADVFVSGLETLPGVKPLNNCRWTLYRRTATGWELQQADPQGRQREPCPLGIFADGRLFLSTNPTLTERDVYSGPANPHLLQLAAAAPQKPGVALQPVWVKNPGFNEHSYRGLGVDGPRQELVLFNNYGYEEQYWAYLDRRGRWANRGIIRYPIRGCYEEVALVNGACHVLAIGDVQEPIEAWRKWKFEKSGGRTWDYVFRRLFYVWNATIATNQFAQPLEVDNLDATAGAINNLDLWVDRQGAAHLLYRKTTVANPAMRDRFFPGKPITTSLEYCVVRRNQVVSRHTLVNGGEGAGAEMPGWARFHATPEGRLLVIYHATGADAQGNRLNENRLLEILPEGGVTGPLKVGLKHPFTSFMTATERGGSTPSRLLDLLGTCSGRPGRMICYARIKL